jgi:predicted HAD superfamily Cof-like phosphohydrolase
MVAEFHTAMGQTIGETPTVRDRFLRRSLIHEEAEETRDALVRCDLVEVADGLCDLIYVALGTAVACGIDLEPIFAEVHRTNMAKLQGGHKREDGKWQKPAGWQPPRIAELQKAQGWKEP